MEMKESKELLKIKSRLKMDVQTFRVKSLFVYYFFFLYNSSSWQIVFLNNSDTEKKLMTCKF